MLKAESIKAARSLPHAFRHSAARRKLRKMTDNKQRLPINWPSEIQDFPLVKAGS